MAASVQQFYRPSMAVTLRLRFDEAYTVDESPDPVSISQQQSGAAVPQQPSVRPLILEAGAVGAGNMLTKTSFLNPIAIANAALKGGQDRLSVLMQRVPISGSVELPGYIQAGTFTLTFPWKDVPIDPRVVRSCAVEIYLGCISQEDFAVGVIKVESDGTRRSIIRPEVDNCIMVGLVDEWSTSFSNGTSTVSMTGRDLRGVFLDSPVDSKLFRNLVLSKPIDDVVQQIIALHPFGARVKVQTNPADWGAGAQAEGPRNLAGAPVTTAPSALPSPGTVDKLTAIRSAVGSNGKTRSTPPGGSGALNFWDLITRYCLLCGVVPYFHGHELWIRPGKSLYDQTQAGMDPKNRTPFAGGKPRTATLGTPGISTPFSVRKLVYGRELAELSFQRKQSGVKAPIIECVSINTDSKDRKQRLITARWPDPKAHPKAAKTSVAPSGAASMTDVLRIPVPGVKDVQALQAIARGIFQMVGRGEMGGSFTTRSLASFGGNDTDPDLLRMRPGDGVELLVDTRGLQQNNPLVNEFTESYRRSFQEQVNEVAMRLGNTQGAKDLARVVVATARGRIPELQPFFRISTMRWEWSLNQLGISGDFQNYIEARGDNTASGPNTSPTKAIAASAKKAGH